MFVPITNFHISTVKDLNYTLADQQLKSNHSTNLNPTSSANKAIEPSRHASMQPESETVQVTHLTTYITQVSFYHRLWLR